MRPTAFLTTSRTGLHKQLQSQITSEVELLLCGSACGSDLECEAVSRIEKNYTKQTESGWGSDLKSHSEWGLARDFPSRTAIHLASELTTPSELLMCSVSLPVMVIWLALRLVTAAVYLTACQTIVG